MDSRDGSASKKIPIELHSQLETDSRYNVYLKRQLEDIKAYKKETKIQIPTNFDFNQIKGLSNETKDILNNVKPTTIFFLFGYYIICCFNKTFF